MVTTSLQGTLGGLRGITAAWIVLCALTIGSWWLSPAHSDAPASSNLAITVAVVAVGVIKCRLIIGFFMEVRSAPRWLVLATDGWLLVLWSAILVIALY